MLLFVYNRRREIVGNETFLFTGKDLSFYGWKKQTQASTFVTIFLRQWKMMIDSFLWNQYKLFKVNNMKQFNKSNL